jgi:uncharacterized protein YjbJ (UPF0337 family)
MRHFAQTVKPRDFILLRTDPSVQGCAHTNAILEHLMNKDQVKGDVKKVKGHVKETAGKIFGDKTLENKGKLQNAGGKIQKSYGDAKEEVKKGS